MSRKITDQLDDALRYEFAEDDASTPHSPEVSALLAVAAQVRRSVPDHDPSPGRAAALARLQRALMDERDRMAKSRAAAERRGRLPPPFAKAAAAALTVGVIVAATSAAGADILSPIDKLFTSENETKVSGIVLEAKSGTLLVETGDGVIEVIIGEETEVVDSEKTPLDPDSLSIGQTVDVKGIESADGSIEAVRIRLED